LGSPFVLRTAQPAISTAVGHRVLRLERIGKRVAFGLDNDLWIVIHLMIAGRLHWLETGAKLSGRHRLAAFDFLHGTLLLTEAGTKKRASLHLLGDEEALRAHDPGGLEVLGASVDAFAKALTAQNHTLKRALTDPRLFSGIGNAYSDEILHRARLSPVALTQKLSREAIERLHQATQQTLEHWIETLRQEVGEVARASPYDGLAHAAPDGPGGVWQDCRCGKEKEIWIVLSERTV
jgi:formamidopyrimidine-DNA glycosylase